MSSSGGSINVFVGVKWATVIATAVASVAVATTVVVTGGGGGGDVANLWVDTNGGTCTRQGTAGAYSDAGACSSFDAAWDAATAGDQIRVKAGTYGSQTITGDKASETTITGEDGVTTGPLSLGANHTHITNVTADSGSGHDTGLDVGGDNVTATDFNAVGDFVVANIVGSDFTWNGGQFMDASQGERDFCTGGDGEPLTIQGGADGTLITRLTIYGAQAQQEDPDCNHLETVRIDGTNSLVDDTTISFNTFLPGGDDNTSKVFITAGVGNGTDPSNVQILGNYFGSAPAVPINVRNAAAPCGTYKVAYNTFHDWDQTIQCTNTTGMVWVGNLGGKAGGACWGTFTKNRWTGSVNRSCGTDTFQSGGVDFTGGSGAGSVPLVLKFNAADGKLASDSSAINAGENTLCTSLVGNLDIDGSTRSGVCDAGADEYEAP